ncbi:MAG: TonB-dependent receptor [bacterium]
MNKLKFVIHLFLILKTLTLSSQTSQLSGTISDEQGQGIQFANISIHELSLSTISNENGSYFFSSIPRGEYYLNVTRTGYINTTILAIINSEDVSNNITLEKSLIETPSIDVTSSFNATDISNSTFSITSIGPRTLSRIRSQNIASTIQNVPGVNNFSTGNSIGKPVIRGLSSQSVIIVHDGVKHESQQWGDEHAPEISMFDLDRIEILRGPASLVYGSDGIGGVVNIVSKPLTFSSGNKMMTYGNIDLNGFSMNKEGAANLMLGIGTKNFGIKGYAGLRKGEDIRTPDGELTIETPEGERTLIGGKLFNSGSREFEGGTRLGFKSTFGTINAEWQNFKREIQIHEDPEEEFEATPNQKIVTNHYEVKGNLYLNKNLRLEPLLSYEVQDRKEFESIADKDVDNSVLNLYMKILQTDLRLNHKYIKDVEGTVGIGIQKMDNKTLAVEKLIPNYTASSYSAYISEKIEKKRFAFSIGGRYDNKIQNIEETIFETDEFGNAIKTVLPRELKFNSFSGSVGFVYKPDPRIDLYTNLGTGWRPPSEFDLYADGVHEGTGRFDRGLITNDSLLDPESERSLNIDAGTRIRTKYFSGEISFFRNVINNFIYPSPTGEVDSASNLPVYDIRQAKSSFIGFEYSLQFQLAKWALLSFRGDYVQTKNRQTNDPIPFTPPSKTIIELKLQKDNLGKLFNPYITVSSKFVAAQNKVDPLESPSKSYTLLGAGIGFDYILSKSVTSIDFSVTNLTNEKYTEHLSRYRYYALNPGRSFNLKITVPFQF